VGKVEPTVSRDYAAEASNNPKTADLVKGSMLLCALDERTCLTCLEHDGLAPPSPVPIHEGCRCVTLPVLRSFAELGIPLREPPHGTRSSAIGQVPEDGGLYKRYLLCRARGVAAGLIGGVLVEHVRQWLAMKASGVAAEPEVAAAVRATLLVSNTDTSNEDLLAILDALPWTAPDLSTVVSACSARGLHAAVDAALRRLITSVPDGPYAGRHRASLCRTAAGSMQDIAPDRAHQYLIRATELDPMSTAPLMDLAKMLRQQLDLPGARRCIERVLILNPAHKGAQAELNRLMKASR
jgi:hypothetical protein